MLKTLEISNYALIDHIEIAFDSGLNIITGETGAGKSIILGALSLLLGARADQRVVRKAESKSVIEAEFDIRDNEDMHKLLSDNQLDDTGESCILRRELQPGGRSRAFINDTPVSLTALRQAAILLVDIHSQHQNLLIADPSFQLSIIDTLADNAAERQAYCEAYTHYRELLRAYTDMRDRLQRYRADRDYIEYQFNQLDQLDLQAGEETELEAEREALDRDLTVCRSAEEALTELSSGEDCAVDQVSRAAQACRELAETLPDAAELAERLESVRIEIADIADTLSAIHEDNFVDANRISEIDDRLALIYGLLSRHHVNTSAELVAVLDDLRQRIDYLENGADDLAALEEEAKAAKRVALEAAAALTATRTACAERFALELRERALPLGMANLQCEIAIERTKLSPSGADSIDFRFAFNKQQELMPVGQTASGGEISRLMLVIKSIVAERMQLPTIIFDEVDTGVSGDIAARMGVLMERISRKIQVVCITHLPAVAVCGTTHYKVYKADTDEATNTHIKRLDTEARIAEIALMLSGKADDESALAAARNMIDNALKTKE